MNSLIREAAASVDLGWLLGALTVLFLAIFIAWVWVAYAPKNRDKWEEASRMPFMDGGES